MSYQAGLTAAGNRRPHAGVAAAGNDRPRRCRWISSDAAAAARLDRPRSLRAAVVGGAALAALVLAAPAAVWGAAPEGSYQKSCKDIQMSADGATLSATCKQHDGTWHPTNLSGLKDCTDAVANLNGNLRCNKGGVPPEGSYSASCREIWLEAGTLHAACDDGQGHTVANDLQSVSTCTSRVANIHGHLTCAQGGKPPAGTYSRSCWDVVVNGSSLAATCRAINGSSRSSTLSLTEPCRGAVRDVDGYLTCNRGSADPPPGSYLKTCIDIKVDGNALQARCEDTTGTPVATHLDDDRGCTAIANHNGTLSCVKPK
jgi:CVNH domain